MISLSKSGNTVTFTFDENSGYLQNGTINVPVNSLSLILDESNMATFRKSASNDIFVSANIAEFGMSKSDLETFYKNNMVGSTGGGGGGVTSGEVQTMIDESISAATDDMATETWVGEQGYITGVDLSNYATLDNVAEAVSGKADIGDIPDVSNYFDGAEYDSGTTRINFYHGNTVKAYIDASAFIVDGMIDDVRIETISGASYLVIDFNTASGKEDIQIPLTDIFDPSNYYNKTEVDAALSGKADTSAVTASINAAVSGKADTLIEGRAIDITNNTISLDLPISAGTGNYSIQEGFITQANGDYSHAEGFDVKANGYRSHAEGFNTQANGNNSHTEGFYTIASGENSHAEGKNTLASGNTSHAEGTNTIANNKSEHASGQYNVSSSASTTFGDSGNTLFSVGNGTADDARHNAFEIRQDGAIYFSKDGSDVKLQDSLFSGSYNDLTDKPTIPTSASQLTNDAGYITSDALSGYAESSAVTEEISAAVSVKVDTSSVVTAVTSASTDSEIPTAKAVYDAVGQGGGGSGSSTVELTQAAYDALVSGGTVDPTTYYIITDATPIDISNYYTSAQTESAITSAVSTIQDSLSGYVQTSAITSAVTSASTDSEIPTAKAVYDAIPTGGTGGGSYSAGTNIDITNDTISCTLPIEESGGGIILRNSGNSNAGANTNTRNIIIGYECKTLKDNSSCQALFGSKLQTYNTSEFACGSLNVSNSGSTLFSVGNGSNEYARHNALEIRKNGDIYITSGGTDIKLQDNLGGGSGYVTTDTEQIISGRKIFTYSASSSKAIEFKQTDDSAKVGFRVRTSAETNNELASFEFRPNTFTIDNVQHPLLYFGHWRNSNMANAGIQQTVIGFRQYDQLNAAAYHYLMPLPEKAKTPFSLTTSFKDYYAPIGFKNGSTMITAADTGVVDLSSELDGLKLKKLTQAEYDALVSGGTVDSSTLYIITNVVN